MNDPAGSSLDDRYLAFRDTTAPVFAALPELETCRFPVFRNLVIGHSGASAVDLGRHYARRVLGSTSLQGPLRPADVLVWVESAREVIVGALMPVCQALEGRGVEVQVVALNGPANLTPGTHHIRSVRPAGGQPWRAEAWNRLTEAEPGLRSPLLKRAFFIEAAKGQALLGEAARVLDAVRPKAVLSAATNLPGAAALVIEARRRRIPSLLFQHGITQVFYTPVLDDVMLTWGPTSNQTLHRFGVPGDRLVAVGSPRHDGMRSRELDQARAELCRALGLPVRPTLVFFSNGNDSVRNGDAPRQCAAWLAHAAGEELDMNVVVRLHPNEDGSLYSGASTLRIVKGVPDFETTLAGCDVASSLCSTVLYEALLFRKPIWQFFADGWPVLADNWRDGLAARVASPEALVEMMRRRLDGCADGLADQATVDSVFANHGNAAERAAAEVRRRAFGLEQA